MGALRVLAASVVSELAQRCGADDGRRAVTTARSVMEYVPLDVIEPNSTTGDDPPALQRLERSAPADELALSVLYETHRGELFAFLLRMTRDREVAEDLLQETFVRLITETRAGRMPEQVRAWLYRVAANAAISRGRHGSVWNRLVPRLVDRREPASPESEVLRTERESELHTALAGLARCPCRSAARRAGFQRPRGRGLDRAHRGGHTHAPLSLPRPTPSRPRSGGGSGMSIRQLDDPRAHDRALELAAIAVDFDLTAAERRARGPYRDLRDMRQTRGVPAR